MQKNSIWRLKLSKHFRREKGLFESRKQKCVVRTNKSEAENNNREMLFLSLAPLSCGENNKTTSHAIVWAR